MLFFFNHMALTSQDCVVGNFVVDKQDQSVSKLTNQRNGMQGKGCEENL
jgi:hypothetical protein